MKIRQGGMKRKNFGLLLVGVLATGFAIGIHAEENAHQHDQKHASDVVLEQGNAVRGIFLGYDEAEHRVTIAHEAVPDVMMAMRMHLALPDGEPTPDFSVGDKVAFQMFSRVENGRSWYAKELEALPADTELELPEELRDKIGH